MTRQRIQRFCKASAMASSQLIACLLTACHGVAQPAASASGAIAGYVYCADSNTPARMATVRVQSLDSLGLDANGPNQNPTNGAVTSTGLDGAFRVDGLAPGDYVVLASLRGYLFPLAEYTWRDLTVDRNTPADAARKRVERVLPRVSVDAGQTASVTVRLERGAEISGAVFFDDGSPVIGAQILIYRTSSDTHQWESIQQSSDFGWSQMLTDDHGQFRASGLPAGEYLASARLPASASSGSAILGAGLRIDWAGYAGQLQVYFGDTLRQKLAAVMDIASGERRSGVDIRIPLSKLRTLSGSVKAESDGHPLKNTVLGLSYPDDKTTLVRAHGADDGAFKISFVLDGEYILTASAAPELNSHGRREYGSVQIPLSVNGDTNGVEVTLPDAPTANGAP